MHAERRNRVHTFTRWPKKQTERRELAARDLEFVEALDRCGIDVTQDESLRQIVATAERVLEQE